MGIFIVDVILDRRDTILCGENFICPLSRLLTAVECPRPSPPPPSSPSSPSWGCLCGCRRRTLIGIIIAISSCIRMGTLSRPRGIVLVNQLGVGVGGGDMQSVRKTLLCRAAPHNITSSSSFAETLQITVFSVLYQSSHRISGAEQSAVQKI